MKNFLIFIAIILLSCVIASIYGIIHDQLTYTISPEYYTKFKFYQFGLIDIGSEAIFQNPRNQVAVVGFLATWWMGIPIGLILGLVGFVHKDSNQMFKVIMQSVFIIVVVTFFIGLIGLAYGKFNLANTGVDWWLPDNLINHKNFIAVGSMHNFSYIGGIIGMIAAVAYILKSRKSTKIGAEKTVSHPNE